MFNTTTPNFNYFISTWARHGTPYQDSAVFEDFKVDLYPDWLHTAKLVWLPNPAWANPQFNVYRGESEPGEYDKLNAAPINGVTFSDFDTQKVSKYSRDYYIVEVLVNGLVIGRSKPIYPHKVLPTWHELRAREMNRREWWLLSRFAGNEVLILKHFDYGKYSFRCPECWNPVNMSVTKDYCKTCYGTSYEKGYYAGIPTYMQFEAYAKQDILTDEGAQEPATVECWTIRYPGIDAKDLIIRKKDFTIWKVDSVNRSEMLNNPVRQIMRANLLRKTMVEYELLKREGLIPND